MLGIVLMGVAASLFGAVCSLLCLRELRRKDAPGAQSGAQTEDGGEDAELREGILNLMRYAPAENRKGEE